MSKLSKNPCEYSSGYSLNLYCKWENEEHDFQEFPHEYDSETFGECAKAARNRGWIIHRNRLATCPKCRFYHE